MTKKVNKQELFEEFITKWSFLKGLIVALCVFYLFKTDIEKILFQPFIEKVFSKVPVVSDTNYLFWSVIVWLFFYHVIKMKDRYVPSKKFFLILVSLECLYFYYLNIHKQWVFTAISKESCFNYMTILHCLLIFNLILLFQQGLLSCIRKFYGIKKEVILLNDEPIESFADDKLGIELFIENISNVIVNSKSENTLAFGITGKWGSGKTSFINLIKKKLEPNDEIVFIDFNPWQIIGKNTIVDAFFKAIDSKINKYSSGVSKLLTTYKEDILSLNEGIANKIISKGFSYFENDDIQEQVEQIDTILKKIEKQFIIVIDDIDRLSKEEIILVLKLIRNFHKFSNIKFIVAYDRSYVINAIKGLNEVEANNYLDKIFIYNFAVPLLKTFMGTLLFDNLKSSFKKESNEIDSIFYKGYPSSSEDTMITVLRNIRDIKRFMNFSTQSYALIKEEVFFPDFIRIELLRFLYPEVYNIFYQKRDYFIGVGVDNSPGVWPNYNKPYKLLKENIRDDSGEQRIVSYLQKNKDNLNIKEDDIKDIERLINGLFYGYDPNTNLKNNHIRFTFPKYIQRYFYFRIFDFELSEYEFNNVIDNYNENEIKEIAASWMKKNLTSSILERILIIDLKLIKVKKRYENIVNLLFFLDEKNPNRQEEFGYQNPNFYQITKLLKNTMTTQFIDIYDNENDLIEFWKAKLVLNHFNRFNFFLIRELIPDEIQGNGNIRESNDINIFNTDLEQMIKDYFFHFCTENPELKSEHFDIAKSCFDIEKSIYGIDERCYNEDVMAKMRSLAHEYPTQLLESLIQWQSDKYFSIVLDLVKLVFTSLEEFERFITQLDINEVEGKDEFIDFYEQYKRTNDLVEFSFLKLRTGFKPPIEDENMPNIELID